MNQQQAGDLGSWELPEVVWQAMEPLIPPRRSKEGRPRSMPAPNDQKMQG